LLYWQTVCYSKSDVSDISKVYMVVYRDSVAQWEVSETGR
jgi:hypothetical protein